MYTVALTGGIGSGKSVVSHLFAEKHITVIDTDVIARHVVEPGMPGFNHVIQLLGFDVLSPDKQQLDRNKVSHIIFNNPYKREQLEALLHPLIWEQVQLELKKSTSAYSLVVVPLLIEKINIKVDSKPHFDRILVIDAEEHQQIERVQQRDKCDKELVEKIIASQVSREERLKYADDIIVNTADIRALQSSVNELHNKYLASAKTHV